LANDRPKILWFIFTAEYYHQSIISAAKNVGIAYFVGFCYNVDVLQKASCCVHLGFAYNCNNALQKCQHKKGIILYNCESEEKCMSPKDNFAQTMKDLLGGSDSGTPSKEEKKTQSIPGAESPAPASISTASQGYAYTAPATPATSSLASSAPATAANAPTPAASTSGAPAQYVSAQAFQTPSNEVTVIAPGTKIVGDIEADGGLRVGGDIKGNIKVAGQLELNGKVIGDIEAQDITIVSTMVRGNVTARNLINVDKDTTIVGDVAAQNAEIDGKVKGNLTAKERAHLQADAILVGNLASGTVNIEEGAMLKGDIAITSAQSEVDVKDFDFEIDIK
jgi:cytoskeletal protein CcmA (bactofilin family)